MGRPIELTILGPIQSTHRAHDVCFVRVLHCEPAVVFWCEYTFAGQTNLGLCWEKVHPRSLSQLGGSAGRRKGIPLVRLSSTSCAKWRQWKAWRTCGSRGDQVAGVCRQRSNAKQNWSRFVAPWGVTNFVSPSGSCVSEPGRGGRHFTIAPPAPLFF